MILRFSPGNLYPPIIHFVSYCHNISWHVILSLIVMIFHFVSTCHDMSFCLSLSWHVILSLIIMPHRIIDSKIYNEPDLCLCGWLYKQNPTGVSAYFLKLSAMGSIGRASIESRRGWRQYLSLPPFHHLNPMKCLDYRRVFWCLKMMFAMYNRRRCRLWRKPRAEKREK